MDDGLFYFKDGKQSRCFVYSVYKDAEKHDSEHFDLIVCRVDGRQVTWEHVVDVPYSADGKPIDGGYFTDKDGSEADINAGSDQTMV